MLHDSVQICDVLTDVDRIFRSRSHIFRDSVISLP